MSVNVVESKPRELPEFVDDLVRIGTAELVAQLGAEEAQAKTVMARIADGIVTAYARTTMYVPAGFGSRNTVIWDKFHQPGPTAARNTRARVEEIAAEYGMTTRQIYSILAVMRSAQNARFQHHLPGFEDLR